LTVHVGDVWWRETILLYAAQADATPIVEPNRETSIAESLYDLAC